LQTNHATQHGTEYRPATVTITLGAPSGGAGIVGQASLLS
jgi:hypothetical protein